MRKRTVAVLLSTTLCGGCIVTDDGVRVLVRPRNDPHLDSARLLVSVPLMAASGLVVATRRAVRAARTRRRDRPVVPDYRDPSAPTDDELAANWSRIKRRSR